MRKTYVCFNCKESFLATEMVEYAGPNAKISHRYCPKCYEEKISRDNFSQEICKIFGLKKPGAQIFKERRKLFDKYGYTDNIIIECLHYIYEIKQIPKKKPTLYYVTPQNINEMLMYKKKQTVQATNIGCALQQQQVVHHIVPIKENKERKKTEYSLNPDDWLNID